MQGEGRVCRGRGGCAGGGGAGRGGGGCTGGGAGAGPAREGGGGGAGPASVDAVPAEPGSPEAIRRSTWALILRKVVGCDAPVCPRCGTEGVSRAPRRVAADRTLAVRVLDPDDAGHSRGRPRPGSASEPGSPPAGRASARPKPRSRSGSHRVQSAERRRPLACWMA